MGHEIQFQPSGIRANADAETSVLQAAQSVGLNLTAVCNGAGYCGKCRVEVVLGEVTLTDGSVAGGGSSHLACQIRPATDLVVLVPESALEAGQRLQVECAALKVDDSATGWVLQTGVPNLGLAFDMGSTKVAGYLVGLDKKHVVATAAGANEQMVFGEDIISRIAYCNRGEEEYGQVRDALRRSVNAVLEELFADADVERGDVRGGGPSGEHGYASLDVRPAGEASGRSSVSACGV